MSTRLSDILKRSKLVKGPMKANSWLDNGMNMNTEVDYLRGDLFNDIPSSVLSSDCWFENDACRPKECNPCSESSDGKHRLCFFMTTDYAIKMLNSNYVLEPMTGRDIVRSKLILNRFTTLVRYWRQYNAKYEEIYVQ